eukprot:8365720-Alexandrium_andersonii.AAC.1
MPAASPRTASSALRPREAQRPRDREPCRAALRLLVPGPPCALCPARSVERLGQHAGTSPRTASLGATPARPRTASRGAAAIGSGPPLA